MSSPRGPATFHFQHDEPYNELVTGDGRIFESQARLLIFAACLGYNRSRSVADHDTDGEMRWSYIAEHPKLSIMAASLAYAATNDPNAMLDPKRQIEVLTKYAAGGSEILIDEIIDAPGDNLDLLIELLRDERDTAELTDKVEVLKQIEQEVSSLR